MNALDERQSCRHRDTVVHVAILGAIATSISLAATLWERARTIERRCRAQQAMLDTVLETPPVGLALLDRDLCVVVLNSRLAEMLGTSPRTALGRPFPEIAGRFWPALQPCVDRVRETGQPLVSSGDEGVLAIPDQQRYWVVDCFPVQSELAPRLALAIEIVDVTERKAAQEARDRLARHLQLLLESTDEGIYGVDLQGRCTFINRAGAELLGYRPEEVVGTNVHQLVHSRRPDGSPFPESECPITRSIRTGRSVRVDEDVFWRRDGLPLPVAYSSVPIVERGAITGAVVAFADLTVRKRAEEARLTLAREEAICRAVDDERNRLQAILQSAAGAIVYVDVTSGKVLANPQATRLFGRPMTPETGLGQILAHLRAPNGEPLPPGRYPIERALHGETVEHEEILVERADGSRVSALISASPIRGPGDTVVGAVAILQDISEIKQVERLRQEWISVIAHDLRQPVTLITGYASLLARQFRQPGHEHEVKALERVITSATSLNKMISDLIDLSRLEIHRLALELQIVDLPRLVREVVDRNEEMLKGHSVRIQVEGTIPPVQVDPMRIEQVLENLLSNAAKYSYPKTEIEIRIARRGNAVLVSVTNRGPGIPPEEMPRLFTRFYRTREARAQKIAGLGLGLYISKGLVEAHGGKIWAESVPGQTTTFTFSLPIERGAAER